MSPAAAAQSCSEAQEALAESKARSVISYSPEEIFQKSWQSYQLVVDAGLLGHAKLASAIASQLAELRRARGKPLRVLDLGSGDAGSLTRALSAEASRLSRPSSPASASPPPAAASAAAAADFIAQYTGVDESRPALALAAENVARSLPGTEGRFFEGDLLSAAERSSRGGKSGAGASSSESGLPPPPEGGYDAIVASLSAHHLSTEAGKPALVAAARRALLLLPRSEEEGGGAGGEGEGASASSPSGSLLIVADVFLNDGDDGDDGDTVDAWRRRSCAVIREQWPLRVPGGALSAEEADRIASHVGSCDIPTTVAQYAAFAKEAAFKRCVKVADVEEELGIKVIVMEA